MQSTFNTIKKEIYGHVYEYVEGTEYLNERQCKTLDRAIHEACYSFLSGKKIYEIDEIEVSKQVFDGVIDSDAYVFFKVVKNDVATAGQIALANYYSFRIGKGGAMFLYTKNGNKRYIKGVYQAEW